MTRVAGEAAPRAEHPRLPSSMTQPTQIHPTAIVEDGAQIGMGVRVDAYALVGAGTVVGDGCHLRAHCILHPGTILEAKVLVDCHAVLGGDPQDVKFDRDTPSGVHIGEGAVIREHVTINRATRPNARTSVGANTFLLAACHVPHDAQIGPHTIVANGVLFGGFVEVGPYCFIGGSAVFHQHMRVGEGVMVSGNASTGLDAAPFTLVAERNGMHGLNYLGMRRRGFSKDEVSEVRRLFREVLDVPGNVRQHALSQTAETAPGKRFLDFFQGGTRGFLSRYETRRRTGQVQE
ncbi:MAG: acyl-ACP--UDP-N-acetylglucosamine O-acyltransferase [Opitutales bacterium]